MSDFIEKYNKYCETCQQLVNNTFDCGIFKAQNSYDNLIALSRDEKLDSCKSKVPFNLEQQHNNIFTTKLTNSYNFYGNINVNLLPTEKISKMVLKINDNELPIQQNKFIFTVPYNKLILEITIDNMQHDRDRIAWIDSYTFQFGEHIKKERIYAIVFENSNRPIENTKEEQEIATMLEKMHFCPICELKASSVCCCEQRDSCCANGHNWHYNCENNKIIIGKGSH